MAKYMIVIKAKSKYFRYLNEHKVTNLFIFHMKWERAGMRVYQFFHYESGRIDKQSKDKTYFLTLGLLRKKDT